MGGGEGEGGGCQFFFKIIFVIKHFNVGDFTVSEGHGHSLVILKLG